MPSGNIGRDIPSLQLPLALGMPWACIPQLSDTFQELIHLSEAPVLANVGQGTPPDLLGPEVSMVHNCSPTRLYIFMYVKTAA